MTKHARLILAVVVGFIINLLLFPPLPLLMSVVAWCIYAVLAWITIGFFSNVSEENKAKSIPSDFQATVRHRNIAIDTHSDQLWICPVAGKARVLRKDEVQTWTHEWVERSNSFRINRLKNTLILRISDVQNPLVKVAFENYEVAEAWKARIGSWINR